MGVKSGELITLVTHAIEGFAGVAIDDRSIADTTELLIDVMPGDNPAPGT